MPRRGYTPRSTQAARPNRLTAVYSLRGGKPAVPESLWAPRPEQAPPRRPHPAKSGCCPSFGGSRRLAGEAELGQRRRVLQRRPSPLLPCPAFQWRRLGMRKWGGSERCETSATPSPGLAETPSGGCGKDGFFLRLSHLLNYRNNSAAVLLSCDVVGSLPASLMDGSAPCCRWSLTISARPQNTAICNGVSPSLFQAFGYAPRLRRFHDLDAALKRRLAAPSRIYPWRLDLPHL